MMSSFTENKKHESDKDSVVKIKNDSYTILECRPLRVPVDCTDHSTGDVEWSVCDAWIWRLEEFLETLLCSLCMMESHTSISVVAMSSNHSVGLFVYFLRGIYFARKIVFGNSRNYYIFHRDSFCSQRNQTDAFVF